jgi:hypothetical protein
MRHDPRGDTKRVRRAPWALAFAAAALLASSATAQVRLEGLEIRLWPEYDRPSVLVILDATLAADTALPAIVPLPMPTAVGAPHAVAKKGPSGSLLVAQYTVEAADDWSTVKIITDLLAVHLEYYAPLANADSQRRFRFFWPAGTPISRLSYEVLHPMGATNMSVTPAADRVVEADGLTFYQADLGARPGGESFSLTLTYAKQTATLSSPAAQAAPSALSTAPAPAVETGTSSFSPDLTWLPLALIALAVAVGLRFMFRSPPQQDKD